PVDKRRRWALRAGLFFGMAVIAVLIFLFWVRITTGHDFHDLSTRIRISMYRSSWRMFRDYPVFGIGAGALGGAFSAYREPIIELVVDHVHNDWLECLLQFG